MEYYIEIKEKMTNLNEYKPREVYRKYVSDVPEAESEYAKEFSKFTTAVDVVFVEMNHDIDPTKNKPCISKKFKDGKVVF